jgi:hypothetical protein
MVLAVIVCIFFAATSEAQVGRFARKGVMELGGSVSFNSITPVINGNSGNATSVFAIQPYLGYFLFDGFELGVNPLGITITSPPTGDSQTELGFFLAPAYNFYVGGIVYPFIEGLIGYTSVSQGGSSASGISFGGRGGIKVALTGKGLLNLGIEYRLITTNPSGADKRFGYNLLAITAGFTVWL